MSASDKIPHAVYSRRMVAAGIHLLASVIVAAITAAAVFAIWYPSPYPALAGGFTLFAILISVDVVLGPMLTAITASPHKPMRELRRDLTCIVALQLVAFGYGIYTIALARPVAISFEVDRFRVVTAADIEPSSLDGAPPGLRHLSWSGPRLIAAVKPTNPDEQLRSIDLGLAGIDLSMVPRNWRSYESESSAVWLAAKPTMHLLARYPQISAEASRIRREAGLSEGDEIRFLPVMSRHESWVALLSGPNARIVGFLPVDGFI